MEVDQVAWYSELRAVLERYATREGCTDNQALFFRVGERVERVTYLSVDQQGVALNATGSVAVYPDWKKGDRYERILKALAFGTVPGEWEPPVMKSQLDQLQAYAQEVKPPQRKEGKAEVEPVQEDRLQQAIEAVRANPSITSDELTRVMGFRYAMEGAFWRVKALDALGLLPRTQSTIPTEQVQPEREKQTMQQSPQKQGFFSRFFGRGGPQPHSADMNYDDLYLDDDTDGPGGALVPSASSRASDVTFPPPRRAQKLNTSNMTQEQLRTRRTNVIEGSKFGRPAHENFMLFLLRFWLLIGPIAFVILTTSEVAYILTSLTAPGDKSTLIITGGALFIDLAMMFTTFGVAIKRRDQAEKREANGGVLAKREEAEVWFGTALWLIFAAINIIGQSAFLLHIISASGARDLTILYIFVASRVVGFILGDASTAFFLAGVDNSHLKLIARGEREKASLYSDISKAEGERRLIEAKAEAEIILLEIKVQQERDDALFLADLKKQAFGAALGNRPQLPPPAEEPSGPNKSRLRRLDSN